MELIYNNPAYHFEIVAANDSIPELSVYAVEKYLQRLRKTAKVATLKKHRAAISHGLKCSLEKKLISEELHLDLSRFLREFKTGKPALNIQTTTILTQEDINLLLAGIEIQKGNKTNSKKNIIPSPEMRQIFLILSKTGLRISELILLRKADIKEVSGTYKCFIRGKGSIERVVYLDKETIDSTYSTFSGNYYLCQFGDTDKPYSDLEQEQIRKRVWYAIRIACKYILGRSDIHPHSIRDFFANNLLNIRKMDLKAVSLYLGHQSTDTTTKYYQQSKIDPVELFHDKNG